ncbi:hypothetical protein N2152v2_000022 [Parachlorella kessleri]
MAKPKEVEASPEVAKAAAWLNSYAKASTWMGRYDIHRLLDASGGLVRIENFLPEFVAEAVLQVLQAIPTAKWNPTTAGKDYAQNNISHQFWSTKHASAIIDAVVRVIGLLLPGQLNAFSAARYDASHHIAPHDDRAYTPVQLDTGEVITCSREIGVIWYLTKDWRAEHGGALVDLEAAGGRKAYVPLFNSVVMFRVPRFHEVTPVTSSRPRYSLFGWFLQPGRRYELFTGEAPQQQEAGPEHAQRAQHAPSTGGDGDTLAPPTGQQQEQQQQAGGRQQRGGRQQGGAKAQGAAADGATGRRPSGRLSLGARGGSGELKAAPVGGLAGVGLREAAAEEGMVKCKLAQRIAKNAAKRRRRSSDAPMAGA